MTEVWERDHGELYRVKMQRLDTIKKYLGGKNEQNLVTIWTWRLREREMICVIIRFPTTSFFFPDNPNSFLCSH